MFVEYGFEQYAGFGRNGKPLLKYCNYMTPDVTDLKDARASASAASSGGMLEFLVPEAENILKGKETDDGKTVMVTTSRTIGESWAVQV